MSKYTKEDIIKSAQENNVEFIRLQFTDMFGTLKNVAECGHYPVSAGEGAGQ